MVAISPSLVILGCSQRKKRTSRLISAIERYDGPLFQVLRKHIRNVQSEPLCTSVLSGRFGLVPGETEIPRYDHQLDRDDYPKLRMLVERQLKQTLDELQPEKLFVSVGCRYWPLIEGPLSRDVATESLVLATGSIGRRASQFAHWLQSAEPVTQEDSLKHTPGEAVLLSTTLRISREEILREAGNALLTDPLAARRFETWYVEVEGEQVAPKWLVSLLFDKPVSRFRTQDARRVLSLLGVECKFASR